MPVALLVLVGSGTLTAQLNRASITGTVVDSSGALVADADVIATNIDTGEASSGRTNSYGRYSIFDLFPGRYSLHFSKAGFRPIDLPNIALQSTQVAKFDETLVAGEMTQAIEVIAAAPVLDTESASVGTNLTGRLITDLPLNIYGGRQIETFAQMLTPGYSPLSNPYTAVINGTQAFTKDYTVDGTSGTAQIQGDSMETGPTMESVQEVRADTTGIDAENAITNGGVIMLNLKSGTNRFHGSAFGYGHNELLDARVWGNPDKPKSRFWDWGGSIGGPIFKNKTFFFGAFERYQQNNFGLGTLGSGTGAATVPTTAFLNGDFSALLDKTKLLGTDINGNPVYAGAIFNPADPGATFVGNVIPQNRISSVSKKIVGIYQKYYAPQSTSLVGNERFLTSNSPSQTPDQPVVKIDHDISDRNRLSGSWIYNYRPRLLADSGGVWQLGTNDGGPLASDRYQKVVSHQFRMSDSWTIAPNILNIFNVTYNRYWNGSVPPETADWNAQLGLGSTGAANFPQTSFGSAVNGIGETGIGNTWQGFYVGNTFLYGDSLSWSKGRHTFMFGGDFRAMQNNSVSGSGAYTINFVPNTTGFAGQSWSNQVGFGFASFLLGDVQSASQSTPINLYARRKAMDLFAQDSWKIAPKLTVNIGLRWDVNFRLHEKYGHWANFDFNTVDPALGIEGALVYAHNGSDSFEKNQDWHNFGPTLGIAWNPTRHLVLRAALNITYAPIGIQYWTGTPYGFAPGFRGTNASTAPFNWDSGYPGVFVPGQKTTTMPVNILGATISPDSLEAGYTDNWNIGVQYELKKSMSVEVSYIANRGHHLQDSQLWANETTPAQFQALMHSGNGLQWVCSAAQAAAYGVPYPYAGFCAPALAAVAPYPQLASAEANYWYYPNMFYVGLPLGQSYYDSMAVQFVKRFGAGLTVLFNYTLSRQESDVYSNFGDSYDTPGIQAYTNLTEAAHTLTPYDQKNVFKGAVSYDLPLGHGRRWLAGARGLTNGLLGGWRLSGLVLYASGKPLTFTSSNYYYYPLWAATYVNYNLSGYGGRQFDPGQFQVITDSNNPPAVDRYFPATIASNPAYGDFGSGPERIDALRGFGQKNENVSLMKNARLGAEGKYTLQFRLEFYNILNRHTFADPITNLSSSEFGYVPGVISTPREGQFGVRFEF